jgi:hypothetical protein
MSKRGSLDGSVGHDGRSSRNEGGMDHRRGCVVEVHPSILEAIVDLALQLLQKVRYRSRSESDPAVSSSTALAHESSRHERCLEGSDVLVVLGSEVSAG